MTGNNIKIVFLMCVGTMGAYLNTMFSRHNGAILTLVVFMSVDYIVGIVVAGVFKKSKKLVMGA